MEVSIYEDFDVTAESPSAVASPPASPSAVASPPASPSTPDHASSAREL